MPIIRTLLRHEENFTQIPNEWLRDGRLSLKAIGLLSQLLSHSQGWSVSIETLAKANNCGRDLIRAAVAELEQAGYLSRKQERKGSLFAEAIYYTTAPDSPLSGFPLSENPMSENPTPKNTKIKKNIEKKVNAQNRFNEFWERYPRHIGKSAALRAYLRALETEPEENILAGVERLSTDPNLPLPQFIPYPATWLNREGWNDDAYPERKKSAEEIAEENKAAAALRRERELARSRELLEQMKSADDTAAPMPICEHGKKLVFCVVCSRKSANG